MHFRFQLIVSNFNENNSIHQLISNFWKQMHSSKDQER